MCFVSHSSSLFWQAVAAANNLAHSLLFEISKTSDIKSSPSDMATPVVEFHVRHSTYTRNNMHQKCGGQFWFVDSLWNIFFLNPENTKKMLEPLNSTTNSATQIGLDWLCYLDGNSQTAPMIFFIFLGFKKNYFIKNPQITIAPAFLTHIIVCFKKTFTHLLLYTVANV
jgi:hypothetical protein